MKSKPKKEIKVNGASAKNPQQKLAFKTINENQITFLYGFSGSGKTHVALHYGLGSILRGEFSRLILSRPCVEAYGEKLGFLPGDASEKIEPYILPMLDLIGHTYSVKDIQGMIRDKIIISRPIAYMRGMTFINDYVVLDEGQNTIAAQMRLLLTRIGENSKIVVTGDTTQSDIDGLNGLTDAIKRLEGIPGIGIVKFTEESVVRSQIIREIEKRYLANNNE